MAAIRTQVVFDASEPHALAAFWAEALHYEHEEIDAFVSGLVDAGHVPADYTIEIDGNDGGGRSRPYAIPMTASTSAARARAGASSSKRCPRRRR